MISHRLSKEQDVVFVLMYFSSELFNGKMKTLKRMVKNMLMKWICRSNNCKRNGSVITGMENVAQVKQVQVYMNWHRVRCLLCKRLQVLWCDQDPGNMDVDIYLCSLHANEGTQNLSLYMESYKLETLWIEIMSNEPFQLCTESSVCDSYCDFRKKWIKSVWSEQL